MPFLTKVATSKKVTGLKIRERLLVTLVSVNMDCRHPETLGCPERRIRTKADKRSVNSSTYGVSMKDRDFSETHNYAFNDWTLGTTERRRSDDADKLMNSLGNRATSK